MFRSVAAVFMVNFFSRPLLLGTGFFLFLHVFMICVSVCVAVSSSNCALGYIHHGGLSSRPFSFSTSGVAREPLDLESARKN